MQQMVKKDIPISQSYPMHLVEQGFMKHRSGRIYFLMAHGNDTVPFAVMEDGSISRKADVDAIVPGNIPIDLVHPKDLGITHFRWAE